MHAAERRQKTTPQSSSAKPVRAPTALVGSCWRYAVTRRTSWSFTGLHHSLHNIKPRCATASTSEITARYQSPGETVLMRDAGKTSVADTLASALELYTPHLALQRSDAQTVDAPPSPAPQKAPSLYCQPRHPRSRVWRPCRNILPMLSLRHRTAKASRGPAYLSKLHVRHVARSWRGIWSQG